MATFLHILLYNIMPLLILAVLGYRIDSKFHAHMQVLSKLTLYAVLPAVIFRGIYEMKRTSDFVVLIIAGLVFLAFHAVLAGIIAKWQGWGKGKTEMFRNITMYTNSGNVGVSTIALIFSSIPYVCGDSEPYLADAMAVITVLLVLTNVLMNTVGYFRAGCGRKAAKDVAKRVAGLPIIYVTLAAIIVKILDWPVDQWFIWPAITNTAAAMPLIAMTTLGIQLHRTSLFLWDSEVWITVLTRLVIGPIAALAIIYGYGKFDPLTAQVFFIYSAVPSSVNSVIFAVEFDNHPGFATQTVMLSFVLSSITLTTVIYLARVLFPLTTF